MFSITQHAMPIKQQERKALIQREREIFARNFKRARKEAGLTQNALAKITGTTQAFISNVEKAKTTINLDNANILAEAVGQPLRKLLSPVEQ